MVGVGEWGSEVSLRILCLNPGWKDSQLYQTLNVRCVVHNRRLTWREILSNLFEGLKT